MEQQTIEGTHKPEREKTEGETLRDAGIERVAEHNPDFLTAARGVAREMARDNGGEVWADDLRLELDARGILPNHHNAYGCIFHGPEWIPMGFRKSKVPSAHARQIRCWRLRSYDKE